MDDAAGAPFERLVSRTQPVDVDRELETLLADSAPLAFRVAYSILRRRADAEDVAQDALVRAHDRFGSLRDRSRYRAWLVRISFRLALDHRRAAQRRQRRELAAVAPDSGPDAEELAAASEFRERLWRAIDDLPGKLRAVVVLAGIEGHGVGEVARLLELPEGTVKSRLHSARRRLAEVLR